MVLADIRSTRIFNQHGMISPHPPERGATLRGHDPFAPETGREAIVLSATTKRVERKTAESINRRIAAEIARERYALKALRGDFRDVEHDPAPIRAAAALQAVNA
ncbi:MAG TPA: hypothetical protein VHO91_14330 [Rhodopila sp.]|nr:hypothetical protein [Rhodopila sp.]